MRFAREDQLNGTLRIEQQSLGPIEVRKEQNRPLIGGETPGEADGQRRGVEEGDQSAELGGPVPLAGRLLSYALTHEMDQSLLLRASCRDETLIGSVAQLLPGPGVQKKRAPVRVELLGEVRPHLGADPGFGVHPVRDGKDGGLVIFREEVPPHPG